MTEFLQAMQAICNSSSSNGSYNSNNSSSSSNSNNDDSNAQEQGSAPLRRPDAKIEFQSFSGEAEDWNDWSQAHRAQLTALGCVDVLNATGDDELEVGREDFDSRSCDPTKLSKANQVWVSLITNCNGIALEIVQGSVSPSQAWRRLAQHYHASNTGFYKLGMDFLLSLIHI